MLTNVAKVQERRGAKREARATLRRALELDPNQDNGLLWWASDAREAGGDSEYVAALEAIAVLPGAWRPQLWLAREKLKAAIARARWRSTIRCWRARATPPTCS